MKHASLFSGIGGFDLAAEWMNWENVFHCELNEFGQKVLKYYWPNAISYEDITKTDFTIHRGTIDILTGGFPCQPYSLAGKRKGKEDDRHLWPEMLRAIREIQPRYIVGENVLGLVGWSRGLVFEEVCSDLENEGYEVQPVILPACAIDAPHRRERVWFISRLISNSGSNGQYRDKEHEKGINGIKCGVSQHESDTLYGERITSNADSKRRCSRNNKRQDAEYVDTRSEAFRFRGDFEGWPTVAPLCFRDDGISSKLDGITFPKFRNESIKGAGNAIVPQVAYEIFKIIKQLKNDKQK